MMSKQSMRSSQTMPQLFYTRQDIQEQYLSTTTVRKNQELANNNNNNTPSTSSSKRTSNKRARSSDSKQIGPKQQDDKENKSVLDGDLHGHSESDEDGQAEEEDSSLVAATNDNSGLSSTDNNGSRQARSRAKAKAKKGRKRRKRARSASLFSACFTIPNLGSMLNSQTNSTSSHSATGGGPSGAQSKQSKHRSILAHLGQKLTLGQGNQASGNKQNRRPISASQTAGNLQQIAGQQQDVGSTSSPLSQQASNGARKHVSFGANQKQQQQARADNQAALELGQTSANTGGSNNVIMRNYKAHHQPQVAAQAKAQEAPTGEPLGMNQRENTAAYNERINGQLRGQPQQAPIYLVSQTTHRSPQESIKQGPTSISTPLQGTTSSAATTPSSPQAQAMYLQSHPANRGMVLNQPQCHQHQQAVTDFHQNPNSVSHQATIAATSIGRQYPSSGTAHQGYLTQQQQIYQPKPTLYKRLPTVPMRTQATQTEITAYHLMGTPPLSSGASSVAGHHQSLQQTSMQNQMNQPAMRQHVCQMHGTGSAMSGFQDTPLGSGGPPSASETPDRRSPVDVDSFKRRAPFPESAATSAKMTPASFKATTPTESTSNEQQQLEDSTSGTEKQSELHKDKMQNKQKIVLEGSDEWSAEELELSTDRGAVQEESQSCVGVSGGSQPESDLAAGGGEEEEEEEEEEKEVGGNKGATRQITIGECGNFDASTLASPSSSSCSSSAASLVGHDSTLAAKLLDSASEAPLKEGAVNEASALLSAETKAATGKETFASSTKRKKAQSGNVQDGLASSGDASIMIRSSDQGQQKAGTSSARGEKQQKQQPEHTNVATAERRKVKLKNDNNRVGLLAGPVDETANGLAKSADIEPPVQFKDDGLSGAGGVFKESANSSEMKFTGSEDGEATFMNMNVGLTFVPGAQDEPTTSAGGRQYAEMADLEPLELERAPSPPSLSEASSQTDASLAPNIFEIGSSLALGQEQSRPAHSVDWSGAEPDSRKLSDAFLEHKTELASGEITPKARIASHSARTLEMASSVDSCEPGIGKDKDSSDDKVATGLEPVSRRRRSEDQAERAATGLILARKAEFGQTDQSERRRASGTRVAQEFGTATTSVADNQFVSRREQAEPSKRSGQNKMSLGKHNVEREFCDKTEAPAWSGQSPSEHTNRPRGSSLGAPEGAQKREEFGDATGRPRMGSKEREASADGRKKDEDGIIIDNNNNGLRQRRESDLGKQAMSKAKGTDRSDLLSLLDNEELELSETGAAPSAAAPASTPTPALHFKRGTRTGSQSPSENKRRDEFLALAANELAAIAAGQLEEQESSLALMQQTGGSGNSRSNKTTSTRSTTSTLSTRHHSYCSADDFGFAAGVGLAEFSADSSAGLAGSIISSSGAGPAIAEETAEGASVGLFASQDEARAALTSSQAPAGKEAASTRRRRDSSGTTRDIGGKSVLGGQQQQQQQRRSSAGGFRSGSISAVPREPLLAPSIGARDGGGSGNKVHQSPLEEEGRRISSAGSARSQKEAPLGAASSSSAPIAAAAANGADKSGFNETIRRNWKEHGRQCSSREEPAETQIERQSQQKQQRQEANQETEQAASEESRVRFMIASGYKNLLDEQQDSSEQAHLAASSKTSSSRANKVRSAPSSSQVVETGTKESSKQLAKPTDKAAASASRSSSRSSSGSSSSPSSSSRSSASASSSSSSSANSASTASSEEAVASLSPSSGSLSFLEKGSPKAAAATTKLPQAASLSSHSQAVNRSGNLLADREKEQRQLELEQEQPTRSVLPESSTAADKRQQQQQQQISKAPLRKSSASPPTTVSELDQDEELSTPSFVDSYKKRVAQVCQVAESVVDELMRECLASAATNTEGAPDAATTPSQKSASFELRDGQLMRIDGRRRASEHTRPTTQHSTSSSVIVGQQQPTTTGSSSASSSTAENSLTSTTSLSGHSYVCCHPKDTPHAQVERLRPRLPEKPAHLQRPAAVTRRDEGKEAACCQAIAVTASSIAAAAVLHTSYQPARPICVEACQTPVSDRELLVKEEANQEEESKKEDTRRDSLEAGQRRRSSEASQGSANLVEVSAGQEELWQQKQQVGRQQEQQQQQQRFSADTSSQAGSFEVPGPALTCSRSGSTSACSSSANSVIVAKHSSAASTPEALDTCTENERARRESSLGLSLSQPGADLVGLDLGREPVEGAGLEWASSSSFSGGPVAAGGAEVPQPADESAGGGQLVAGPDVESSPQSAASRSVDLTTTTQSSFTRTTSTTSADSRQATLGSVDNQQESSTNRSEAPSGTGTTADTSPNSSSGGEQALVEQHQQQQQQQQPSAGNLSQEQSFPIRRSSQELSTVSEESEVEMSNGQTSLLAHKQQLTGRPEPVMAVANVFSGNLPQQHQHQHLEAPKVATGELTQMQDLTTEQDLAHSEYTLRSQLSEEANVEVMPSEATSESSEQLGWSQRSQPPTRREEEQLLDSGRERQVASAGVWPSGNGDQVISETQVKAGSSSPAAQTSLQQQQQQPAELRRRSSGSCSNTSPAPATGVTRSAGGSGSGSMKALVDCPYVRDIMPLSPDSRSGPSSPLPLVTPGGVAGGHHLTSRLSHDDTMEAIEDDIEGEEQELQEQMKAQVDSAGFSIAPPAAFGGESAVSGTGSTSLERACTPAESIKEEDEEEEEENQEEDEESSISVSQHGVIVSQEAPATKRQKSSSSTTTPSAGQLTPSNSRQLEEASELPLVEDDTKRDELPESSSTVLPVSGLVGSTSGKVASTHEAGELSKESSNDSGSATHAILEHLSKHHRELTLDEPSPTLEQSRPVDPQLRRQSWRRESGRRQTSAQAATASDELQRRSQPDSTTTPITTSNTGTMKRKSKTNTAQEEKMAATTTANIDNNDLVDDKLEALEVKQGRAQESQQQQQRGPPLAQTRPNVASTDKQAGSNQNQQVVTRQSSASLPTDTSICSSCSCLEEAEPGVGVEQSVVVLQARAPAGSSGTPLGATTTLASGPSGERAAWMSQEEGTVFTENYWLAHWLYISEHEESEIWRRAIDMNAANGEQVAATTSNQHSTTTTTTTSSGTKTSQELVAGMPKEMTEFASTSSERSFSAKYKSTTRKMIHRRASIEMYKRIMNNNLKREKRVEISKSNGEFGFRIHGSRPVVVSAIERGTSAETCGLQVGDLIYAINGTNILDMAHSDVVKLAHSADSSSLVLDLVPTNDFLRMSKYNRAANKHHEPTVTGFLMRLSPSTAQPLLMELQDQMSQVSGVSSQQRAKRLNEVMRLAWRQRYFVLRSDNCLYWYRSPNDIEPYGGINLQGFSASLTNEFSEPNFVIRLVKYAGQPHYLGTNNVCDIQTWIDAINKAATEANQDDPYMKRTLTLARTKPNQIPEPDCSGYLYKFSHKRSGGAHWRAAFFVLKDACLYLFRDQQADFVNQASAVYYLHGYRVRHKHIEHKKHTFELVPPNRKTIRPMFLMANSELDKKRWIAALEYSIDRWIEID